MNCQDFVEIVFELADERMAVLSATVRRTALAHALGCADCAAQLRAARRLDESLADAAVATEAAVAPARLKQSLLAAFEQHRAAAPVVAPPPMKRAWFNLRRLFAWSPRLNWETGIAWMAAVILIGMTLMLLYNVVYWMKTPQPETAITKPTPQPSPKPSTTPTPDLAHAQPAAASQRRAVPRIAAVPRSRAPRQATEALPATNASDLATTGFMPLTYTATAPQDGMVVRVAVPRATLLAMGLPVNAERTEENVKADVLMGMDGVALAIRLVNERGAR